MGQAGYERARDVFSWETIADKTVLDEQKVLDEQRSKSESSAGPVSAFL